MVTVMGYDADVYWRDERSSAFGVIVQVNNTEWFEIPAVSNVSIPLSEERLKESGLGQRVREWKNVVKEDEKLTIECDMEESASSTWDLAQLIKFSAASTTPCQVGLVIRLDLNRDGTKDYWIYAVGAIFDELEISTAINEVTKVKMVFNCQYLEPRATERKDAALIYTAVAAPAVVTWLQASLTKANDGVDDNWAAVGAITQLSEFSINIKNNTTKHWGYTAAFIPYNIQVGLEEVTGKFTKEFVDAAEITEITGERMGRITFAVATGETIQVENVSFDTLDTDFSEGELSMQEIPWTGDSYTFP